MTYAPVRNRCAKSDPVSVRIERFGCLSVVERRLISAWQTW